MMDFSCRLPTPRVQHRRPGQRAILLRCPNPECNEQLVQRLENPIAVCHACGCKWEWGRLMQGPLGRVVRAGRKGGEGR